MGHSQAEEQKLFLKVLYYLYTIKYIPTEKDLDFMREHYERLNTPELLSWLKKSSNETYRKE